MISMTYGTLPLQAQFEDAFYRECSDGYRITLNSSDSQAVEGFKLGDGTWTADQLWEALNEIVNATQVAPEPEEQSHYYLKLDSALNIVSGIMQTLGFEWI